jgi:hypothetical protein
MERDKVGWCSCGRSGRQHHTRVSSGGEPELFIRSRWKCFAVAPVIHERVEYTSR